MKHFLPAFLCLLSLSLVSCAPKKEQVYVRVVNAGQVLIVNNTVASSQGLAFGNEFIEAGTFKDFNGEAVFSPKDRLTVKWARPDGSKNEREINLDANLPQTGFDNRFALVITDDNQCVVKLIDRATNQLIN